LNVYASEDPGRERFYLVTPKQKFIIMEFNQEIHAKLDIIFHKYNFEIIDERKNYILLQSPYLKIILGYNPYEKLNNLFFYTLSPNSKTIEINNKILNLYFKSNLRLDSSIENYAPALAIFFQQEAKSILEGNIEEIDKLVSYAKKQDEIYTNKFTKPKI
jgi:hypothetical protein